MVNTLCLLNNVFKTIWFILTNISYFSISYGYTNMDLWNGTDYASIWWVCFVMFEIMNCDYFFYIFPGNSGFEFHISARAYSRHRSCGFLTCLFGKWTAIAGHQKVIFIDIYMWQGEIFQGCQQQLFWNKRFESIHKNTIIKPAIS